MTVKKNVSKQGSSDKGKKTTKPKNTAPTKTATAKEATPGTKLSALSAAARVLRERGEALTCPEMIAAMAAQGYWTSPSGKTPAATLHAAITREIKVKGPEARFQKTERGKFASTGVA
jgi:hypothetical protein